MCCYHSPPLFLVRYFFVPQPQPPRFSSCGLEVEQLPPAFFSSLLVSHPEVLVPHFSSFISLFLLIGKTCHPHKEQLPRQTQRSAKSTDLSRLRHPSLTQGRVARITGVARITRITRVTRVAGSIPLLSLLSLPPLELLNKKGKIEKWRGE